MVLLNVHRNHLRFIGDGAGGGVAGERGGESMS